ncbi:MAG: response regulator [Polyangiaceae bacterium]
MDASILVALDEPSSAEELATTLRGFGFGVAATVATASDLLAAIERERPSLILIDVGFGGENAGIATAAQLRERFDVSVVYLTAFPDDAMLARAKATSPYGYLIKPFTDRELKTAIDVALHKHELEASAAKERWFSAEFDGSGEILIAIDAGSVVRFLSASAEGLTALRTRDAVGKSLADVLKLVSVDGQPASRAQGQRLPKTFHVAAPGERVVELHDVSDRMILEKRLGVAERLVSVGAMAAGTAVEIDSPLTYVISNMSAATDRIESIRAHLSERSVVERSSVEAELSELGEILREASEGAERVRGIVHELHRFAGARSRAATLVDLPNVLDLAAKAIDSMVGSRARIRREYGTTPFVQANEGELTQLFTNLLSNAADSIDEGAPEKNSIRIVTFTDDVGRAVIEVRDTGHGVAPQQLAHVFDREFTTRPFGEDRGLGLSICRGIVQALRGEITMDSTLGEGTCVRVALPPTRPAEKARATLRGGGTVGAWRRGRILIIDDDPAVARSTARVLTRDHDVFVENEGARALERLLGEEIFDVILCDLAMPGISGADLYETISSTRPELATRFVFLTGGAFSREARAFLDGVPNVSLQKPFSIDSLRKILRDYIR